MRLHVVVRHAPAVVVHDPEVVLGGGNALRGRLAVPSETENRETAVRNRDRVGAKMTAAQIAEAQRLAREWKPK